ncbi:NADH dehydrogenase [ubiquinone] iron-sulfur protein 5-like [Pecten maximus]|uniref:NADH dehydrogenase [ubiquinone] iron-sulfur protein 5-like n=1 Tax=Pecten maximus TaxID=6579 RepID=UPI001458A3DF|nr:NADH dehydrogenase [ubiquinone] iron-sulfur protein 5-like [Pecten maximus]
MVEPRLPIAYQTQLARYSGNLFPMHETHPKCQGLEREYFTCLSNYGFDKGKEKCASEKLNFIECKYSIKAKKRRIIMTAERYKQGKEPLPEGPAHHYATPFL